MTKPEYPRIPKSNALRAQTSFRLSDATMERVRALTLKTQKERPGLDISQGDVIREALEIGLAVLDGGSSAGES